MFNCYLKVLKCFKNVFNKISKKALAPMERKHLQELSSLMIGADNSFLSSTQSSTGLLPVTFCYSLIVPDAAAWMTFPNQSGANMFEPVEPIKPMVPKNTFQNSLMGQKTMNYSVNTFHY